MQTAVIDDKGTQFAYLDSGAPNSDNYTTLVVVHGHTFHAKVFQKLVDLASKYNLRVVAPNRRDYAGSTLFTPQELAQLNSPDSQRHKAFLMERGLELAEFMLCFIRKHNIPKAGDDGKGGMALLGWSSGNNTTIAFLGHLDTFPPEVVAGLEPYLRTQIIFEAAYFSLGYPPPEGEYMLMRDTSIPVESRDAAFGVWVSSYFTHPDLESKTLSGLEMRIPTSPRRPSTLETLIPEEVPSMVDPVGAQRSEPQFNDLIKPETLHSQTLSAVFDPEIASRLLPKLKVRYIWSKDTLWAIVWGAWEFEKEMKEKAKGRDISTTILESGNHFLHWDDPDKALQVFSDAICQPQGSYTS